jgi:hypothetical protein
VSKRSERLSDAPTSVFVITAADIRRSGARRCAWHPTSTWHRSAPPTTR